MFVKPSGAQRARARRESPRSGSSDKHVHPAPDNRGPRLPAAIPCRRVAWPRIPMLLAKSAKMPQIGPSSYTYAEARWSETLRDWIGAHVNPPHE
jgi:hypothetical protein